MPTTATPIRTPLIQPGNAAIKFKPVLKAATPAELAKFSIDEKHTALGGDRGGFGPALEDMKPCADKVGFFRRYQGGVIYWSPATQAHEVHGGILAKWAALGYERTLGYPVTDEKGTPDGRGRYSHFQHGSIYWTPTTGAQEVHGDILKKWASLGYERSFLGYPLTDESSTPDGIGRFNRFEGGMIYWTPATGAQEVHGGILSKWASLGYERSWLGYPISDESDFDEGGRVSTFQHGAIYWWPDTGAIEMNDVIVHYTGLVCFGETDWDGGSNADEPYAILGTVTPTGTGAFKTQVYGDVDAGESRPDLIELYRGKPRGMGVTVQLMENDYDDPERYRQEMATVVGQVFTGADVLLSFIPVVGPFIALAAAPVLAAITPAVGAALSRIFGTDDDVLGITTVQITPKQMVTLARTENLTAKAVGYKVQTPLLGGSVGATYRVYFGIVPA